MLDVFNIALHFKPAEPWFAKSKGTRESFLFPPKKCELPVKAFFIFTERESCCDLSEAVVAFDSSASARFFLTMFCTLTSYIFLITDFQKADFHLCQSKVIFPRKVADQDQTMHVNYQGSTTILFCIKKYNKKLQAHGGIRMTSMNLQHQHN